MDFLSNSIWSGISGLAAIIAIIASFILFKKGQSRKILVYDVVSIAPVARINKEVKSRVKILLDNNPIEDALIVVIKLLNASDISIQSTDYENNSPIIFDFEGGAEVLNLDVLETNPDNLKPSFSFNAGHVLLQPLLLNSQDSITFKVLLTNFSNYIDVNCRINGVKSVFLLQNLPSSIMIRKLDKFTNLLFIGSFIVFFIFSVFKGLVRDIPFFKILSFLFSDSMLNTLVSIMFFIAIYFVIYHIAVFRKRYI